MPFTYMSLTAGSGGIKSSEPETRAGPRLLRVISDVLITRLALPLCPRFQTYCRLAANEVQGPILLNKFGGNPKRQADIFTASSVGCRNT